MPELTGEGGKGSTPRKMKISEELYTLRDSLWRLPEGEEKDEVRKKIKEIENG